jgi:hypothetical protein
VTSPGQIQFVTAIASAPALSAAVPTAALLGPVTAGIVDDAGQCAILGTSDGNGTGALETLCADGSSQRMLSQANLAVAALALSNKGQDVILADKGGQQVLRVASYSTSAAVSTLAAASDGLSAPVGIQVTGQQVLVADSGASSLFLIDLTGQQAIASTPLNTAPVRLKPLADSTIALLNDPSSAPFTIFDSQAMQSYFIPTN